MSHNKMPIKRYEDALFDVCAKAAGRSVKAALLFGVCRDAMLFESELKDDIIMVVNEVLAEES